MPDRIARMWNGSAWEIITSTAAAPTAVANYQISAPSSPVTGQIWVDEDDRQFYIWNGSDWISAITTYSYQSTAPSSPVTGQIWVDSDDRQFYVWSGTQWISAITTFTYQSTEPSSPTTGQVWIDSDNTELSVYNGSSWIVSEGHNISLNRKSISQNYLIPSDYNAMSAGPVTINNGITVTITSGSSWCII
jgi:hypothetical protein